MTKTALRHDPAQVNQDTMPHEVEWHKFFGPALPQQNWVPAPRYLMRRDLLLRIFGQKTPGRILELGCGAGALLADLARMGFTGTGVDQSPSARKLAETVTRAFPDLRIVAKNDAEPEESYDYVTAFEVLEHIEDDKAALRDWVRHLRPGGTVVISVPAHPERWNPADVWAGHYRRYRREDLHALMAGAGLIVEDIQCYGFPVANLMERLAAPIYRRQIDRPAKAALDQTGRTEESGSDRRLLTRLWPIYRAFPVAQTFHGILAVQRQFLRTDRGIGYIVIGHKAQP